MSGWAWKRCPLPSRSMPPRCLRETSRQLVLVGTSEDKHAAAHDLVAACRAAHVPTLGFVDGPANIERRFRGRGDASACFRARCGAGAGGILARPAHRRRIPAGAGFHRRRTRTSRASRARSAGSTPSAVARFARRLFPACPAGRPVLVFLAERSGGLDAESIRFAVRHIRSPAVAATPAAPISCWKKCWMRSATLSPRPFVVLRLHPKNDPQEFAAYGTEIDQVSRAEPALDVVYAADAVVGLTTILLSEAAFLGRPRFQSCRARANGNGCWRRRRANCLASGSARP